MAIDAISTDHPFNTKVRDARRDLIPEVEKKIRMPMDEAFPWPRDYQATHTLLFPKGVFHVENLGGLVSLLEPLMVVGLGGMVGFIAKGIIQKIWGI